MITDQHLIFLNFVKRRVIWALDTQSLLSIECAGLDVTIYYTSEHRMEFLVGQLTHWHLKKRITCRTREMQHQLLVKINHAIRLHQRKMKEAETPAPPADGSTLGQKVISYLPHAPFELCDGRRFGLWTMYHPRPS